MSCCLYPVPIRLKTMLSSVPGVLRLALGVVHRFGNGLGRIGRKVG